MRLPRDVSGRELAGLLRRYGYEVTRETADHKSLRVGTLAAILGKIAEHLGIDRDALTKQLFER